MDYEVPAEWNDNQVQFHLEENLCHDNLINRLSDELKKYKEFCYSCNKSTVEIIKVKLNA